MVEKKETIENDLKCEKVKQEKEEDGSWGS